MPSKLRTTTALIASLALVSGHLPVAAIAQDFDASQCEEGEDEAACLARLLEDASGQEAEDATSAVVEQDANQPTVEAADEPEPEAAPSPVQEQTAEPDTPAQDPAVAAETVGAAPVTEAETEQDEAGNEVTASDGGGLEAETTTQDAVTEETLAEETVTDETVTGEAVTEEALTEDAATEDAGPTETISGDVAPESAETPVDQAAPAEGQAPETETGEDALATALAGAADEADRSDGDSAETSADGSDVLVLAPEDMTAEQADVLDAARAAAEAAEAADPIDVDPVAQAEAEIAQAEAEAEEAQQSLAVSSEAAPVLTATEETITEETARRSTEDFGRLLTATSENATDDDDRDRSGLTGTQGLLLGGIAGLAIGSIIAGNREVVNRADDRLVVLRPEGDYQVIRDDDTLLRRPGNTVFTDTFADGSSRNVVTQPDGTQIITVRDRDLRILRRTVVAPDGTRTVLIDDIAVHTPVVVSELPQVQAVAPQRGGITEDADALARALAAEAPIDRGFSLSQIRSIRAVRDLAPAVNLENVTFDTGSAAIAPEQARQLLALGRTMSEAIALNPREVFLIEGHTDATGSASFNLGLSDRRAETVALALTEYFGVPPQNMVIQGYGEEFLLIPTLENERLNRRVAVRRITDLLRVAAAD